MCTVIKGKLALYVIRAKLVSMTGDVDFGNFDSPAGMKSQHSALAHTKTMAREVNLSGKRLPLI